MNFAVILAGGRGERFWPLSRVMSPKQFLKVTGRLTFLQETLKRVKRVIPRENIYIVTNALYEREIKKQVSYLKMSSINILLEPLSKNTAPAICWTADLIYKRDRKAIMSIFPSDHFISNGNEFGRLIKRSIKIAQRGFMVTLGIRPASLHEGYGYLKIGKYLPVYNGYQVDQFVEKPSPHKAKQFLKAGRYFWNCGIFIVEASRLLNEFDKYAHSIYLKIKQLNSGNFKSIWEKLPSVSFDYAVMEKVNRVIMLDASRMGWTDVGSWSELKNFMKRDKNGNILIGDCLDLDSKNIIALGKKRLVATIGLKDLVIIDTDDALLVCDINMSQRVKHIIKMIKQGGRHEHFVCKEVKFIRPK